MTKQTLKIKVFGDNARDVVEGQVFIAKVKSVEGRKVVVLEQQPNTAEARLPFLASAIGEFIFTSLLGGADPRNIKDILAESVEVVEDDFKRNEWR
jgi:predicted GTPase